MKKLKNKNILKNNAIQLMIYILPFIYFMKNMINLCVYLAMNLLWLVSIPKHKYFY